MRELFAPIIGITLVLMAVFVPAAFMPGITGQMYRQFALVIAATALISAINAATLNRRSARCGCGRIPPGQTKNWFYRGFDALYNPVERAYIAPHRAHGRAQRQDLRGGGRADRVPRSPR